MANVLYITAHPLSEDESLSMAVGQQFIEAYQKTNPNDEVVHLDLYTADIPFLDKDVFNGWKKLRTTGSLEELSSDERMKVGRLAELGAQFLLADKYVFVTPMWNFSVPAIMKAYIDAIAVSGKTFTYTKEGAEGLLKGKKALHIQARGDVYSEGPEVNREMGHRYLEVMMDFFGIESFESIIIEGQVKFPTKAKELKEKAINQALNIATTF
ncbi:FMN-dependent NADH-azoreductase [Priestia aryabhattai]|uniref:FMN-dependent NADH-azoreductase n=1 Tax=Bacillaceae TaxID=186817 RepID=UPI000BA0742D|nr:FMN-dependent NADH-azoreductase [Bacillus sp. CBEL-1]OZT13052.1 FMN-dependent NADH-azoreductase [Priestia aryabhattai]TDB51864.1 FMN-dependent NADH-azoreductase [Bacillus sp. CBEL-1]